MTRVTLRDKALYAVDELTGLITAVALVRPSKDVRDVKVRSIRKKWKDKAFAAGVNRQDVIDGCAVLSRRCLGIPRAAGVEGDAGTRRRAGARRREEWLIEADVYRCADRREVVEPLGIGGGHIDAAVAHGRAEIIVPVSAVKGVAGEEVAYPGHIGQIVVRDPPCVVRVSCE